MLLVIIILFYTVVSTQLLGHATVVNTMLVKPITKPTQIEKCQYECLSRVQRTLAMLNVVEKQMSKYLILHTFIPVSAKMAVKYRHILKVLLQCI